MGWRSPVARRDPGGSASSAVDSGGSSQSETHIEDCEERHGQIWRKDEGR